MKIEVNGVQVWYGVEGEVSIDGKVVYTPPVVPTKPAQLFPVNATVSVFGHYVYLPADYDPAKAYPMLIFLHGKGACGNGSTDLKKLFTFDAPTPISEAHEDSFPHKMIIIAPQVSTQKWDGQWAAFIAEMVKRYKPSRIFGAGLSLGAIEWMDYIKRRTGITAVFLVAGKMGISPEEAARVKATCEVHMYCGANDTEYKQASKLFADLTGGTYTEIPNAGHDSRAWGPVFSNHGPEGIYKKIENYGNSI